ncbi:hypothetical protein ACFO1B_00795 [Dactylosporangium siamense]|uniref:Uncharacterized protein n=1 Tax=Dactylosporangium siamense TaxID=685454 RepID=A0A919PH29_9ACTN|nr:hypothetical protein [Dactylosporangium siamense]GIG42113.1 hypothetical protein Dsi01nite_001540 [Dactylosporangium siamense]
MHDTLVSDALRSYVSGGPPMTIDSAGVLAAGRRVRTRRRVGVAAGAAAGVAALAAVSVVVAGLLPGPVSAPAPPAGPGWASLDPAPFCAAAAAPATGPGTAPTSTVNEKNGHVIESPTEPADHAAARLSCYLLGEVPRRLPGATFYRDPDSPGGTVPLQVYRAGVEPSFSSSAIVADARGVGTIGFGVLPAYESPADATAGCQPPACTVRTGPRGEVVTVVVAGLTRNGQVQLVNVRVYLARTITFASAVNANTAATAPAAPGEARVLNDLRAGRPDLPLSIDTLIELIAAPALTLFP